MHALAKVGLVWAVAVLGALFMTTSAQGRHDDGYSLSSASAEAQSAAVSVTSADAPRTAGLALALVVLAGGVIVLAAAPPAATAATAACRRKYATGAEPASDLPLALGLGLLA